MSPILRGPLSAIYIQRVYERNNKNTLLCSHCYLCRNRNISRVHVFSHLPRDAARPINMQINLSEAGDRM